MTNFVTLTRPSLQILEKTQTEVFSVSGFLVRSLMNKIVNSRTSNDTDMKLGPVTKLDKKNTPQKNLTMTSCQKNCDATVTFPI